MRLSGRGLALLFSVGVLSPFFFLTKPAQAISEGAPVHYSADRQVWDRKANKVELFGNAVVHQPGEVLTADYILLDLTLRTLDAKGNCIYTASDAIIYGEQMHFNMDTRTGSIVNGRVSNSRFSLAGERINKLGEGRFQTHWGEYSTCRDCPESWSLLGKDVDTQIEGYAFMDDVTAKIKDAPAFWVPYMIMPMKSKRQTGFLFPGFSGGGYDGVHLVLPFFWAINRSSDMTIAAGEWTSRGPRLEWEGRYALAPKSYAKVNFYETHDQQENNLTNPGADILDRWAVDISQRQQFGLVDEKLRFTEISDNFYLMNFSDIGNNDEEVIPSTLSFTLPTDNVSAYVLATRYRNLLDVDPDPTVQRLGFDPSTVQVIPSAVITTNDKLFFDSRLGTGLTLGMVNFSRTAGMTDAPFTAQNDTSGPGGSGVVFGGPDNPLLRAGTRFSIAPSVFTSFRPGDLVTVTPSMTYQAYTYSFYGTAPDLFRGYPLFQTEISTQLERIYDTDNPDAPKIKHLIRPMLKYSLIPTVTESNANHPFIRNIAMGQSANVQGLNFDDQDIIPLDSTQGPTSYFDPLGNSLAYGFTTQLIRRVGKIDDPNPHYQSLLELQAGQSYSFRRNAIYNAYQPLSRFFTTVNATIGRFTSTTEYEYYPYIVGQPNFISTSINYVLDRGIHQQILNYDRSINLSYTWDQVGCPGTNCTASPTKSVNATLAFSLSDYILPTVTTGYDFIAHNFQNGGAAVAFQSPSRCWKFTVSFPYIVLPDGVHWDTQFDLSLNLTGNSFGGFTDATNQAASH